jgi:excisionase family DNA binding protein
LKKEDRQTMEFYTLQEIADLLKTPLTTIQKFVRDGRLKAVKIGKSYRVEAEDLQKFLESQKKGG